MDKVTITLQNKELIEQILASSPDVEVRAHNAIIDSITKRLIKNVENSYDVNEAVKKAKCNAENEIKKKFFDEKANNYGYGSYYTLRPEYERAVKNAVNQIWLDKIDERVNAVVNNIVPMFEKELRAATETKLRQIQEADFEKVVNAAVRQIMEEKFKK